MSKSDAEGTEPNSAESCSSTIAADEKTLSKKAAKRINRFEKIKEIKKAKRHEKKEKRKIARSMLPESSFQKQEGRISKRDLKLERNRKLKDALLTGIKVAVDFSMENKMNNKEIGKFAGQMRRLYGSNSKADQPFHIYFANIREEGALYKECCRQNEGFTDYLVDRSEKTIVELFCEESIIYLTPDAPQVLDFIDHNMVYVIGGLVDHQVLKDATLSEAEKHCFKTARLPIDKYMKRREGDNFTYSKVLTINQVFDILLKYDEIKDWRIALTYGIPARKGYVPKTVE